MPEAIAMAGNQLDNIYLDELTGHMYPILLSPNQPYLRGIPYWHKIQKCLIMGMWARDSTQGYKKENVYFTLLENWSTQPVSHFYLSNISEGKGACVCVCMFIGYVYLYRKKLYIYNLDYSKPTLGAGGTKEERTPSFMPHNLPCSEGLEKYEFIQQEDTDTVLSSHYATDEGNEIFTDSKSDLIH